MDIFGLSGKALQLCEDRAELLSSNLVNSATPHYKARDFDFQKALQNAGGNTGLEKTHSNHISSSQELAGGETTKYRVPMQMSQDGNTVDAEIERKNFIENSLRYQVNLTFVQNKTDQLMKAIKGD